MVQKKSVVAGVLGVICAVAILGFGAFAQSGGTAFGALHLAPAVATTNTPSSSVSSSGTSASTPYAAITTATATATYSSTGNVGSSSNSYANANPGLVYNTKIGSAPSSQQTIGNVAHSLGNVIFLGVISLVISLVALFAISRRLK